MRHVSLLPFILTSWVLGAEPLTVGANQFPLLPVTTSGLGNSLMRGGGHDWSDPQQTYLQIYTDDLAVSSDGRIYCTTTWEEGHRAAGIYLDGDALADCPTFSTTSGKAVAVNDHWLVYGQQGSIAVFRREPGTNFQAATGHHRIFDESKDAPWVTGLALDGDKVVIASGGRLRTWDLAAGKPLDGQGIATPVFNRIRLDKRGNIWGTVPRKAADFATIPVTLSGTADAEHPLDDAFKNVGDNTYWRDGKGPASLVMDLRGEQKPTILRFSGAGMDGVLEGARVDGASSAAGPWTELARIGKEPGWWPETVITLDERPWKFLRISGSGKMGLRGLQVQVRTPAVPGAVIGIDRSGATIGTLPGITAPVGITYDAKEDRLLVFNDDQDQQIHAFTGLEATPRRDERWMQQGRFGLKGGIVAAKGVFGPARFDLVRGIGLDAAGNLAVFSVGQSGINQSRLESYAPDGNRRWEMKGLAFLDSVETDHGDTTTAWSSVIHYKRDAKGLDGDGWRAVGSTLDCYQYPEDPRIIGGMSHVMGVRRIAGKPFLFVTTQYSDPMTVYRFNADGIAVPCAYFTSKPTSTYPPHAPASGTWKLWQDANGDGRFQAEEWRSGSSLSLTPFTVATNGDVWFNDVRAKGIHHVPVAPTLDAHGAPQWPAASERLLAFPPTFAENPDTIRGLEVAPDGKTLFVFGFTKALPSTIGHNLPLGRMVVRLDLTTPTPTETHHTVLPYDVEFTPGAGHDQTYASAISGEFLFAGYEQRMDVLVLRQADLTPVGRLHLGPQTQTPIFDGPSELIVTRDGATYEMFITEYVGNATSHLRWTPGQADYLPTPTTLAAKREGKVITVSWQPVKGAADWLLERRDLRPEGWGVWQPVGTVAAGLQSWTDEKPAAAACGYRLRARGANGTLSDWSASAWVR